MREVSAQIVVAASCERALRAFLEVDAMRQWWGVERGLVETHEGGVWALAWERSDHGFRYVSTGTIAAYRPGEYLRIENMVYLNPDHVVLGPMQLHVSVSDDEGGTLLAVRQSGYQEGEEWDWYYQAVVQAWPVTLEMVKEFLESSP